MKHITIKYLQSGMSLLASIMILNSVIIFILLDVKKIIQFNVAGGCLSRQYMAARSRVPMLLRKPMQRLRYMPSSSVI